MIYTNVKTADQTCDCILHMKQKTRDIKQHPYVTRNQQLEPRFWENNINKGIEKKNRDLTKKQETLSSQNCVMHEIKNETVIQQYCTIQKRIIDLNIGGKCIPYNEI